MALIKFTRMLLRVFIVVLIPFSFLLRDASAQQEKRLIREGNRLYEKEQFDESELSYRRALEKDGESPQARFNLGNSLYRQDRYDEAVRFFGELADEIDDPLNKSKIYHNLGNSLLMEGRIEESIEAYKHALRNNPADNETRYNLAFAQHLLDEMENQQQDDGGEGDHDQQDDDTENGDQGNGDDHDTGNDQEDQDGSDQGDQGGDDQGDQDESDQGENPEQDHGQKPEQISMEDALRMLEAAEREERRVQEKLMENQSSGSRSHSGRNW